MSNNDVRAQVLQATDIVELISQTVALKRRGGKFVGLCPFHQEKTPSFTVNPGRQAFYCFGCKAGGTAFDFVMKRDRVEFREALEILARAANIELPQFGGGKNAESKNERQAMVEAHSAACRYYEGLLADAKVGRAAQAYLSERGFTGESLKKFQVGLALDAWDGLLKSPLMKRFGPQLLAQAGLVKQRERGEGYYDTFRNRIMFPIRNEQGQIIAFGGRVVPGSTDPAKYLNSPETPLFNKSRAIFGLDLARQRIVETRTVAVVEGYTDVVMAHQFGASNVVSPLGTALTEQHVGILRRFADRIVLLFDADSAGDAAVNRVVQLFLTQPVEISVASMPDGLDPDEFLLQYGVKAFDELLAGSADALGYAWKQLSRRFVSHAGDLTGQQKAVQEYLELLGGARGSGPVDTIRWGAAVARVSRLVEIPVEELHRRFGGKRRTAALPAKGDVRPAAAGPRQPAVPTAQDSAERWVLGGVLLEPKRWQQVQLSVQVEDFQEPVRRKLADIVWAHQREEGEPVFNELLAGLPEDSLRTLAIELVEEVEQLAETDQLLRGALEHFAEVRRKREDERTVAEARRVTGQNASEQSEVELLKRLQESARTPNLRRVGF
jgi:DNA primase